MAALTRRERSVIGLGVGVALAFGAYVYVVEPLVSRSRALAELVPAREATLQQRRLLLAQRDRLAAEREAIAQQLQKESARLLPGPTAPLAASELQKVLKGLARSANVDVRSERVLPTADLAGLQEVPIEFTVAGNIRETVSLLSHLERSRRFLTLKDVKVRVVSVGQPRALLTTLTVAGYLLPSGPASKPAAKPTKAEDDEED